MTGPIPDRLSAAWHRSIESYGAPGDAVATTLAELCRRYREPHRRYHTLEHLDEMLIAAESVIDEADHPSDVHLAIWYHDAVYDVTSTTNESDSAQLAREQLRTLAVPEVMVERVATLVQMTSDHHATAGTDAGVVVDADLWILGSPRPRYRRYVADVRAEYTHVDDDGWRSGRAAVLDAFLERDHIYASARFRRDLEDTARANLSDERAGL